MNEKNNLKEFNWINDDLLKEDPEVHKMSLYLSCTKKVCQLLPGRQAMCFSGEWFISSPDGSSFEHWEDIRAWLESQNFF